MTEMKEANLESLAIAPAEEVKHLLEGENCLCIVMWGHYAHAHKLVTTLFVFCPMLLAGSMFCLGNVPCVSYVLIVLGIPVVSCECCSL